jgi:hypothetical protein
MWMLKQERYHSSVLPDAVLFEQFVEDENGRKLLLRGTEGHLEEGIERFEYQEEKVSLRLMATRVDEVTHVVRDIYTVWLGEALNLEQIRSPSNHISLERAREIARNIKQALLVWRYPGQVAEIMKCHSPAHDVVFVMRGWKDWNSALEANWP